MAIKIDPVTGSPSSSKPISPKESNPIPRDSNPSNSVVPLVSPSTSLESKPTSSELVSKLVNEVITKPKSNENKPGKVELSKQILNILQEYGSESNIPINHPYWSLLNEFRSIT
jgi:hypothetical protein